jgi:hypothetical protein
MKVLDENPKARLRCELLQPVQHRQLTNVDPNVNDSTFGMELNTLGSRTIDFQLRFSF